ncbi:hypothetical protein RJ641_028603 [Dillenia turbinata]|uniref:Uncharacterized protein n=1 Tax=Dillenia turbinata TaxID=194707 RepID=A0AAN8W8C4_9MAGN
MGFLEILEKRRERERVLRVGVVCGGLSAERGIFLNFARSVLDHIQHNDLHVSCYYIDANMNASAIFLPRWKLLYCQSKYQSCLRFPVYSNIPADFDFKFESMMQKRMCNSTILADTIFNYRTKYLPTQQVAYHMPPQFPAEMVDVIRNRASLLFQRLGLHDFAQIDGWFLPPSASVFSSSENMYRKNKWALLLVECSRQAFYSRRLQRNLRVVSISVRLNLQAFADVCVNKPSFFRLCSFKPNENEIQMEYPMSSKTVWTLLYSLVLRHKMEEVLDACIEAVEPSRAATTSICVTNLCYLCTVHGGIGEDGTLQSLLESEGVPYTGPRVAASKTCMDKVATLLALGHMW